MLSIFSCDCWRSVCLLWRNVYLCLLPIFWFFFFLYWTVWAACIVWKLPPCWLHHFIASFLHICLYTVSRNTWYGEHPMRWQMVSEQVSMENRGGINPTCRDWGRLGDTMIWGVRRDTPGGWGWWDKGRQDMVCSGNSTCRDEEQHDALGRAGGFGSPTRSDARGAAGDGAGKEPPELLNAGLDSQCRWLSPWRTLNWEWEGSHLPVRKVTLGLCEGSSSVGWGQYHRLAQKDFWQAFADVEEGLINREKQTRWQEH